MRFHSAWYRLVGLAIDFIDNVALEFIPEGPDWSVVVTIPEQHIRSLQRCST